MSGQPQQHFMAQNPSADPNMVQTIGQRMSDRQAMWDLPPWQRPGQYQYGGGQPWQSAGQQQYGAGRSFGAPYGAGAPPWGRGAYVAGTQPFGNLQPGMYTWGRGGNSAYYANPAEFQSGTAHPLQQRWDAWSTNRDAVRANLGRSSWQL